MGRQVGYRVHTPKSLAALAASPEATYPPPMETPSRKRWALFACLGLVVAFLVQGFAFVRANSQTYDEAVHLAAGYSYLTTHDFRLNPEHPPLLKELAALPVYLRYRLPFRPAPHLWESAEKWAISRDFLYQSGVPADDLLTLARLPGLLMGALLVGLTGWWAYRLWGEKAAVVATALAAFEPNLVAHSCLVTTDVGSALFILLTIYFLWEYGNTPSPWLLAGVGAAMGLALASKFSSILLVGMGGLILLAHVLLPGGALFPGGTAIPTGKRLKQAFLVGGVVFAIATLVILPVYFFQGWSAWVSGLRWQLTKGGLGHAGFFLGEHSQEGWRAYFPVAFLIKTPVGSIFLIALGLLAFRAGSPLTRRDALFLLVPVAVFLFIVIRGRINIGLRYLVPIYPFLFVAAARLTTLLDRRPRFGRVLIGGPLLLTAASVLRATPNDLAYFNELVGGPGQGHRYLGDSNLDWGQGLKELKAFMDREGVPMVYLSYFGTALPEGYGVRYQEAPACGAVKWPPRPVQELPPDVGRELFAVGVTCLQGIYFDDKDTYAWLREREPVARLGYAIHVYDLTGDADAHRRLADVYEKNGQPHLAAAERRRAGGR